jgi:hypothetical protein
MRTLRSSLLLLIIVSACTSSDSGTSGTAETGATGDTASPATTTDAGTSHVSHASHGDGSTAAADTTAAITTTTGDTTPVTDYCNCMLENCHDQYHELWGEDHQGGEAMCKAAAEAVPSVGKPAMSGDSLECRLHFCTIGHDYPPACPRALGAAPCA